MLLAMMLNYQFPIFRLFQLSLWILRPLFREMDLSPSLGEPTQLGPLEGAKVHRSKLATSNWPNCIGSPEDGGRAIS